ncbi:MAG: hypothetical protein EZS28_023597 [Streblomastix strix]|uniref:Serine/threonine specific protein phosphatases domain-containing protein n=1 Tax=Streblomastix strix TaxID=222440 RepID=A0A5J4VEC2_9EUKA|nr:MAG: hypothetical protein EZS28_023597 [Streblomastix strix]
MVEIILLFMLSNPKIEENLSLGRPPFSSDTTERFMRSNAYDIVMRAHEATPLGFHPALHNGRITTVFSSDSYEGPYSLGTVTLVRLSIPSEIHRRQCNFKQQLKEYHQYQQKIESIKKKQSQQTILQQTLTESIPSQIDLKEPVYGSPQTLKQQSEKQDLIQDKIEQKVDEINEIQEVLQPLTTLKNHLLPLIFYLDQKPMSQSTVYLNTRSKVFGDGKSSIIVATVKDLGLAQRSQSKYSRTWDLDQQLSYISREEWKQGKQTTIYSMPLLVAFTASRMTKLTIMRMTDVSIDEQKMMLQTKIMKRKMIREYIIECRRQGKLYCPVRALENWLKVEGAQKEEGNAI